MKVLLAGATGALGVPLTAALRADGHEVIALSRTPRSTTPGVVSVAADALDRDALLRTVDGMAADAVIHEMTALSKPPLRHSGMAMTDRLRTEGTANLLAVARLIGARRFLTQSIILGYGYCDHGENVVTEDYPFGGRRGDRNDPHVVAVRSTEDQAFTAPEGIALRYGVMYGGDIATMGPRLMRRMMPLVTGGVLSWIHHEDAAAATAAALTRGKAGHAYNVVDDRPATFVEVYTAEAQAIGAPPSPRIPRWLLRLTGSHLASFAIDTTLRVSNEKAKTDLRWVPRYRTYRDAAPAINASWPPSSR